MTKFEIIDHLHGLIEYSADNIPLGDDDEENVWRQDVKVLTEVIALIQKYVP